MVTEPKEILKRISSSDIDIQLEGVRCLKNEIIGNPNRKQCFIHLGAVPKIVRILSQSQNQRSAIQAAAALGSFAYGNEDGVDAIVKSGGVAHLLKTLSNEDNKLVEAGLRALKMIFQESASSPREAVFISPAFDRLVSFLDWNEQSFAEDALAVLSKCCKTKQHQELLFKSGALSKMMKLLSSPKSNNQSIAVDGLAKMSEGNIDVCTCLAKRNDVVRMLIRFCKMQSPLLQLRACLVLTNISINGSPSVKSTPYSEELVTVLAQLMDEPIVSDQVPAIMADLALGKKHLQGKLYEAGVFKKLLTILEEGYECGITEYAGTIKAVGVLCQYLQVCRVQLTNQAGIYKLLQAMESEIPEIRVATLFALEAMVFNAEETQGEPKPVVDDEYIKKPPMPYSADPEIRLRELGCAALWLLHMDNPTALKKSSNNEFKLLLHYAQDAETSIQYIAIWAVSNFISSVDEMSYLVMVELPWSLLSSMVRNHSHPVQLIGLRWLRGLSERDNSVGSVIDWSNGELLQLISEKLDMYEFPSNDVLGLAMDVTVSVASSDVEHQTAVMGSEIPPRLLDCLERCNADNVKQRAVDCVIKLTYKDVLPCNGEDGEHADVRKNFLLELGFEETLQKMHDSDVSETLKSKVAEALSYLGPKLKEDEYFMK